jgi:NADPH-dependent 2,4-dienoyl-CoA reductase/sulfur reductase-like enzyme/nitrite reductase/ring-hydroxylating ferredoxin subunit
MQSELKGPDLKAGIVAADLRDGATIVGHVDDEAVALVRRGKDVFAIGATCTHYGGPVGEGLVVGDTIRCPWHHACFDLRTGEALRGPAISALPVYDVEAGERIRVKGKRSSLSPRRGEKLQGEGIAIIGAGASGFAAAEMLNRRGQSVTLFGPEDPVDRPNLSKDYLAGNAPEEWLPLPLPDGIEFVKRRVTAIDARTKTLTLDDGSTRRFDTILLATGADPVHLPIAGSDQPHVHYLRTVADSRAIIAAAQKGRRAVIVGAGFIGLEVAASLRAREVDVVVVAPEDIPFARVMGNDVGRFIQSLHESHGVRFLLGNGVKSIERDAVITSKGERLPADFVIIGAGVRPNTKLAEAAGLKIDNGIVVNEFLETSAPGIYAAGDLARFPDRFGGTAIRVEHWVLAERQGQAFARNMTGSRQPFTDPPFFWSAHYDVMINYVGNAAGWDQFDVRGSLDAHNALIAYRRAGRIVAVATIFKDLESLEIEAAMEAGDADLIDRIVTAG